jgi:hypothetical protein
MAFLFKRLLVCKKPKPIHDSTGRKQDLYSPIMVGRSAPDKKPPPADIQNKRKAYN